MGILNYKLKLLNMGEYLSKPDTTKHTESGENL